MEEEFIKNSNVGLYGSNGRLYARRSIISDSEVYFIREVLLT